MILSRRVLWNKQPEIITGTTRASLLATGLRGGYVCTSWDEMRRDFVGETGPAPGFGDVGIPAFSVSPVGRVHSPTGPNGQAHTQGFNTTTGPAWISSAQGFTLVWHGFIRSNTSPDQTLASIGTMGVAGGNGGSTRTLGIRLVGNNCFGLLAPGGALQNVPLQAGVHTVVGTFALGGATALYVDGKLINTGTTGPVTLTGFNGVIFGADVANPTGLSALVLFYNRVLSGPEVGTISADPYSLLRPQVVRRIITGNITTPGTINTPRIRRVTRTTQPQYGAEIDRSNPITRGLVETVNPISRITSNGAREVLWGDGSYLGNSVGKLGPLRRALVGTNNANGMVSYSGKWAPEPPYTVHSLFVIDALQNDPTAIGGSWANNAWGWKFNISLADGKLKAIVLWGGGGNGAEAITPTALPVGVPILATMVVKIGTLDLYINGAPVVTGVTHSGNGSVSGGNAYYVDMYPFLDQTGSRFNSPSGVYNISVWNRALAASEIASLSANPWQIFAPVQQRFSANIFNTSNVSTRRHIRKVQQTKQPQVPVGIDWSNPTTKYLATAIGWAGGSLVDFVSGKGVDTKTNYAGPITPILKPGGIGMFEPTMSGGSYVGPSNTNYLPIIVWTTFYVDGSVVVSNPVQIAGQTQNTMSLTNQGQCISIYWRNIGGERTVGAALNGDLQNLTFSGLSDGIHTVAVTSALNYPPKLYVDGILVATGTTNTWGFYNGIIATAEYANPTFSSSGAGAAILKGTFYKPVDRDPPLNDQAQSISRNPWQIFAPQRLIVPIASNIGTISRPASDIAVSGWTYTGSSLASSIGESVVDDSTWTTSPPRGSNQSATVLLDLPLPPGSYNITLRGISQYTGAGVYMQFLSATDQVVGSTNNAALTTSYNSQLVPLVITGQTATKVRLTQSA